MSMIKVTYSSDISSTVGVGGEIVKSASELGKQASTIFQCEYEDLKPPKGMTGIHLVALGDSDAYPMNRNGDLFTSEACKNYYQTFVDHGHVFEHHRNKDPKKSIGQIKAAAYNPDMHRIELYIWADNEKAKDHLERLEKTGEASFSMACRVPNDRCFTKGTLILTSKGFRPIEQISVGDVAITADANQRAVTATMVNHAHRLTRVSVRGIPEEIECTPNHPFNVVSREKMRSCLGSINGKPRRHTSKDGTVKCATRGRNIDVSSEWISACELRDGDYIKQKIDSSSDSVTRGVSFAYICGMYVGDGFPIWERCGHGKSGDIDRIVGLSISASSDKKDECIIDRIRHAFISCSGKDVSIMSESDGKKSVSVILRDGLLANRIVSLVGSYSSDKFISSEILGWSIQEKEAFVAGYFDSDGHIGVRAKRHMMRICSSNKGLILSVQRILWSLGIPASSGIGNKIENSKPSSGFAHKTSMYHVFFNKAHKSLVEKSAKLTRDYSEELCGSHSLNVVIIDGYSYIPVVSSRTFDSDDVSVYNFEVDGEHTYIAEGVGVHNCSVCGAIRKSPGDSSECDHIKFQLGKIAEDGTQIGTFNDQPTWFDISFVGRPADRIAWNLKTASAIPEELTINSSVKQAEIEGYVLPDDLAIESDHAKQKLSVMRKLAEYYDKCESWISGDTKPSNKEDRYHREIMKLAGARLDDASISCLREIDPSEAFSALGDAGIVMDAPSFFKYAFGQDFNTVKKYLYPVEKAASAIIRDAVETSSCAEFCNCSLFDPRPSNILSRKTYGLYNGLSKCAAAFGFGVGDDAVGRVLDVVASGNEPEFCCRHEKSAEHSEVDSSVVNKLAKRYAMYKISGICSVLNGKNGSGIPDDDFIFVSAAQDLRRI